MRQKLKKDYEEALERKTEEFYDKYHNDLRKRLDEDFRRNREERIIPPIDPEKRNIEDILEQELRKKERKLPPPPQP